MVTIISRFSGKILASEDKAKTYIITMYKCCPNKASIVKQLRSHISGIDVDRVINEYLEEREKNLKVW